MKLLWEVMAASGVHEALLPHLVSQKRSSLIFLSLRLLRDCCVLAVIIFIFATIRRIQSVSFAPRSSSLAWLAI